MIPPAVVVGGGKGGVGKTTVSLALARELAARGMRVGLVDADLSGPNIDVALDLAGGERVGPVVREGIRVVSPGFQHEPDAPLLHDGHVVRGEVDWLLEERHWEGLDILIVDAPPGTTRVHVELIQTLERAAWVVVTTGSPLALADAVRFGQLVREAECTLLGVVANMAHVGCSACGAPVELFPAHSIATVLRLPILDVLPFDPSGTAGASGVAGAVEAWLASS